MNNQEFPRKSVESIGSVESIESVESVESMKAKCGAHGARRRGNARVAISIFYQGSYL